VGPLLQRAETTSVRHHLRKPSNAELDIKWSGGLGTTAVVAPAVQRPPLQLYMKVCVARQASAINSRIKFMMCLIVAWNGTSEIVVTVTLFQSGNVCCVK